jgi:hypothetical protein
MKSGIEWLLCNLQVKKLVEGNGGALLSNSDMDSRDDVIHLAKPTEISLGRWEIFGMPAVR